MPSSSSSKKITVAIDFDGTFTRDPDLFTKIIYLFLEKGHQVVCITSREGDSQRAQELLDTIGKIIPVVFAGVKYKREAAEEAGFSVDVWVDDFPITIDRIHSVWG